MRDCESCVDNLLGIEGLLTQLRNENLVPVERGFAIQTRKTVAALVDPTLGKIRAAMDALRIPKPAYRWLGYAVFAVAVALIFKPADFAVNIPLISREPAVDEAQMRVQLLAPASRSSVDESQLDFRWTGPSLVQTYVFLLLDGNGEIIWEQKTSEHHISLPSEIQLQPATSYFWQVEGLWPDEGSIISEMASFSHNPK
jgi:hypothetical protein